jgi:zinc protease
VKDGFTADAVAAAKKTWLEERMVQRSQDQSLMGTLSTREFWDRTMKCDEALEQKIAALTPDQISAAFRRHIDPSALTFIKAGRLQESWRLAVARRSFNSLISTRPAETNNKPSSAI